MKVLTHLLVNTAAILVAAYLLSGVQVSNFSTAILVAVVLGALNMFVKPLLVLFTLPITLLTLGLFYFVINALLIMLAGFLVPGFLVSSFLYALAFSLLVSIVASFLNKLL